MNFIRYFFSSQEDIYTEPCGLFSISHIIGLVICLGLIGLTIYFTRNITKEKLIKSCRYMAVVITLLELIKIIHSFYWGYTFLDSWFPLAYCSFLIYTLYMIGYGKGFIQKCGLSFLSGPALIAGVGFLIFPTTSLVNYPIFHYLCFYSLFFHSVMVYYAIMFYKTKAFDYTIANSKYYLALLYPFSVVAITMDYTLNCNMMFYYDPYNMPFKFIVDIYDYSKVLYTIFIFITYSLLYFVIVLLVNIINKLKKEGN